MEWTINCTGDLSEGDIRLAHGYIYIVGYAVKGLTKKHICRYDTERHTIYRLLLVPI